MVFGQWYHLDARQPPGEAREERHVAAPPLVDGLVVIHHHDEGGAELDEGVQQRVLGTVQVLHLVHEDVAHPSGEPRPQTPAVCQLVGGPGDHEPEG